MKRRPVHHLLVLPLILLNHTPVLASVQGAVDDKLAKAIAAMRNIDCRRSPASCDDEMSKRLDDAWKTLETAGPKGTAILKAELGMLEATATRDDFFKLGAASVLWKIGGLSAAADIAAIWSSGVDFTVNYSYVFYTALDAAATQDSRVLPMLTAVLRDQRGQVPLPQHSMTLEWPVTHQYIWGRLGSRGADALLALLADSKDETARASAALLLSRQQHLASLTLLRKLAHEGTGSLRLEAIKALGGFGHPQDFEYLVGGLKGPLDLAYASAYALFEYGDLRAVPALVPLLSTSDARLANEVVGALFQLLTPKGIAALSQCRSRADVGRETARACEESFQAVAARMGMDPKSLDSLPTDSKDQSLKRLRSADDDHLRAKPGDRRLTHDDLLGAADEWKRNLRITGGRFEWVEDRHVLSAATADDIPLLLDVAAACLQRVSDEGFGEAMRIYSLVSRLGRARYRRETGVCEKVQGLPGR